VRLARCEGVTEERHRLADRRIGGVGLAQGVEHHEVVDDALVADRGDRDTGLAQLVCVGLTLVARRMSASAVITSAGGSPASCSRVARSGEAVISLRCAWSVVYWSQNHGMASRRR
jgi:hypothetical protein